MKRRDVVFAGMLAMLAYFVGAEAVREGRKRPRPESTTSYGATPLQTDVPIGDEPTITHRAGFSSPAPGSDYADARRRLAFSSAGTYIDEILAARDSTIARWPERRTDPLRIWIQPTSALVDWSPGNVALVRDAFLEWQEAGIPLSFTFVVDSASATVHIGWIDHFAEPISGKTLWAHDDNAWIVDANIVLAVRHSNGVPLDGAAMRAIALHEIGHLLGLDHTADSTNVMAARVRVRDISPADRATARLLYALPPGRLAERKPGAERRSR